MSSTASSLPRAELVNIAGDTHLQFTIKVRSGGGNGDALNGFVIDGITWTPQAANISSLDNWQSGNSVMEQVGSRINNGDGTETLTFRLRDDISSAGFVRVMIVDNTTR